MTDMSEPQLTDDEILHFTQRKRKAFLTHITQHGFPKEREDQQLMLGVLDSMDRSALGSKRIGAAEKLAGSDRLVAQAITDVVKHFGTRNPFEKEVMGMVADQKVDLALLPSVSPVPGELGIGLEVGDFNDFVKDFE